MTTLIIKDLAISEELDAKSMTAIHGGSHKFAVPAWFPVFPLAEQNLTLDATQMLSQSQNVVNNNGNNVAFSSGISSTVAPTQTGSNNIRL